MLENPIERLRAQIAAGELDADQAQLEVAQRLDTLSWQLGEWQAVRTGFWARLSRAYGTPPRGLYIYGPVGRGKSMLMDLFYACADFNPKLRRHFHEFMVDAHERIAAARFECDGDPIPQVARAFAEEGALLCFDELHVADIADAMILGRLFKHLFELGVVVVATSNSPPRGLYKNGLNRQLFLPFIDLIDEHMEIVPLNAAKDYRLDKIAGLPLYFSPCDARAKAELDTHWDRLTGRHPGTPEALEVKGRMVRIPLASMGIARFDFEDLCEVPLGVLDYLHIAHAYHTVVIDGIPVLTSERRDAARRFINLIDTLYDQGVCLIASAATEPAQLHCCEGDGEAFARTASRLMEMRSEWYLANRGPRHLANTKD